MKNFADMKYLLIFLLGLSTVTAFSIADAESDQSDNHSPTELIKAESFVLQPIPTKFKTRHPSSISEVKNELITVTLPCDGKIKRIQKSSIEQLIMLNLSLCKEDLLAKSISMTNRTNGFKAQMFKMSLTNYRTDFIQLNKGLNKIEVESVLKDGQKRVQTLELLSGS